MQMRMAWVAVMIAALWGPLVRADVGQETQEVEVRVEALMAPTKGFEEKNDIQVVLYGFLSNACYSLGEARIEKTGTGALRVRQFAVQQMDGICADPNLLPEHMKMMIPFTSEVSVGHLAPGDYEFTFEKSNGSEGRRIINVSANSTLRTDSLPYAMVSSISAPDLINGLEPIKITLSGVLNSTCTSLDENVIVTKEDDVFVVMPTIKIKPGVICAQVLVPFQIELNLGNTVPGIHLIHVRSMNGKAVNKVVAVSR